MHLVYVDDSGDSRNGTILTALLVPETPTVTCSCGSPEVSVRA